MKEFTSPAPYGAGSAFDIASGIGYDTPKEELTVFFESEWCSYLLQALGLDEVEFFARLNIT